MTIRKIISLLAAVVFWGILLFFSLLLTHNALLYFTHGGEYGILPEKPIARQHLVWNISFYVHLPTGIICLLVPVVSFSRRFTKGALRYHIITGKLYVLVTLLLVCPTGMYLALYAKGGIVTQVGFLLQGALLALFTYNGYQAGLRGNKDQHVQYMIRSYAMATVVLSFRILHIVFFLWRVPYNDNYAISQWLGLTGNYLLAELFIYYSVINNHSRKTQML